MLISNDCSSMFLYIFLLLQIVASVLSKDVYTNQFVVHCKGGEEKAQEIADKYNLDYLGKVFEDYYHFRHRRITRRSIHPHAEGHRDLTEDPEVLWFSQQKVKRRAKRDLSAAAASYQLNDPFWPRMWYLNRGGGLDMNVKEAWAQGATGNNVVVTILDDGLETQHPDIRRNYDPDASYDVNNFDPDPQPRYDLTDSNRHGTRCAGEVAAEANNSRCSVGVAYNAKIGGVRMLDGDVTDAVEARSIGLNPQHIDIYSASWGPDDDGKTVDGPGQLATRAFMDGVTLGRQGLGSIFVWASGNGGREHDNCNCDGYTNSIWTLSISSATEHGLVPWYSEACSSTLASTYSSGSVGERQISTTDLHNGCTMAHTGTSASAPLAAGICALALDANPLLTWRDMQHLVVRTSRPANLYAKDWKTNGVGRNVSHSFGYGMMDAGALVRLAKNWTTVPTQRMCQVSAHPLNQIVQPQNYIKVEMSVWCGNVSFLEHVQAVVTLSALRRGDLRIYLTSPQGTKSTLLDRRPNDTSRAGFKSWPFLTVHSWGEQPNGKWTLEIHNEGKFMGLGHYHSPHATPSAFRGAFGHSAGMPVLTEWTLRLYGTKEDPDHPRAKVWIEKVDGHKPPVSSLEHEGTLQVLNSKRPLVVAQAEEECKTKLYDPTGECISTCLEQNGFVKVPKDKEGSAVCIQCHYSCRTCMGTNDYECTSCYGDAALNDNGACLPIVLSSQLKMAQNYNAFLTILFIFLVVVVLGSLILLFVMRWRDRSIRGSKLRLIRPISGDNGTLVNYSQLYTKTIDSEDDEEYS